MGTFNDLSGKVFGRLTVLSLHDRKSKHIRWKCICKCGTECIVLGTNLNRGHTISCGCAYDIPHRCCPASGLFFHGKKLINKRNNRGYIEVRIHSKLYLVHRLIWEMVNGTIPEGYEIDHINRVRHDNRISNLRLVTHRDNLLNSAGRPNTSSKYKGVRLVYGGKWAAYCKIDNKYTNLGLFIKETDAAKAYNTYVKSLNLPTAYLNPIDDE